MQGHADITALGQSPIFLAAMAVGLLGIAKTYPQDPVVTLFRS